MKKAFFLIILLVLLLTSGCKSSPAINDFSWKMSTIASIENEQLNVIAVGDSNYAHPEAEVIDMTLIASDGKIILTDNTNSKTYEGTYFIDGKNLRSTSYKITIEGEDGYATVAMTTYLDGSKKPTLPISLGNYTIYFYSD